MIKFFWMPKEIWYYVVIPILAIIVIYFLFWLFYRNKKGSYYYNYVVDYVYSTLGIVFCSLLFCLLLGYSIATVQVVSEAALMQKYLFLVIVLIVLPVAPACFLIYVIRVYVKNLKRKEVLDTALEISKTEEVPKVETDFNFGKPNNELPNDVLQTQKFEESDFELKKKN